MAQITKSLKTIKSDLLPDNLVIKRNNGRWYQYNVINENTNKVVKSFDFKKSVPDLYDAIKSGEINISVTISQTEVTNEVEVPSLASVSALAEKVVPINSNMKQKIKHDTVFLNDIKNETPSVADMFKKELPKQYDGFYFPDFTPALIRRVKEGKNTYLAGESGTGKSEMIEKIAKYVGQTVIRINFHEGITESALIGKWIVKNNETVFAYGLVPLAMQRGYWLLLDEIDYAQPEHTSVLQAVLEGKPLVITSNEGEIIAPHESFRIFATGNTTGRGDSSDSYHGTNFMNAAFLDRWSIFRVSYSKKENKIIEALTNDVELSKKLVKLFNVFRSLKKNGDITNAVFSTRRMINVAEALIGGDTFSEAIEYELFNRYTDDEISILTECIKDVFDYEFYFKGNWKLGKEHFVPQAIDQISIDSTDVPLGSNQQAF
jgi:cobaltochelatase CobS